MKMKVLKATRLKGEDIYPGVVVDLDNNLAGDWEKVGLAERVITPESSKIIPPESAVLRSPQGKKPGSGKEKR